MDLYNQEIISYQLSERPSFDQVVDMLKKAFKKIPTSTELLFHSDQGWQYQMKQFQALLKKKGIVQSMSRKGNCLDNAIIENFSTLVLSPTELHQMEDARSRGLPSNSVLFGLAWYFRE